MNCKACGAPLKAWDEACEYCGTLTDYGKEKFRERESKKKDDERRHKLENRPAMKHVSIAFTAVLYVITAGLYSVYWYAVRMKPLNSLGTRAKISAWLVGIFALVYAGAYMLSNYDLSEYGIDEGMSEAVYDYAIAGVMLASLWLAFTARKILQEYAAGLMDRTHAVYFIAPSNLRLILFGAVCLQSQINKMIEMNLFSPKI